MKRCVSESATSNPVPAREKNKRNAGKCYADYSEIVTTAV